MLKQTFNIGFITRITLTNVSFDIKSYKNASTF